MKDVLAERVGDLDIDLIMYQTLENLAVDAPELLGNRPGTIPAIDLERNSPRPHPVDSPHPAAGSGALIVHVTHFPAPLR